MIFPLFSAEYFQDSSNYCGEGGDHLGKFLDGPPANSANYLANNNFHSVESTYLAQHNARPNLSLGLNVGGFAWYGYQCYKQKQFPSANNQRLNCNGNSWLENKDSNINGDNFSVYPNPAENHLKFSFNLKDAEIEVIRLYSIIGERHYDLAFEVNGEFGLADISQIPRGGF